MPNVTVANGNTFEILLANAPLAQIINPTTQPDEYVRALNTLDRERRFWTFVPGTRIPLYLTRAEEGR